MPDEMPLDQNIVANLRSLGDADLVRDIIELFASDATTRLSEIRERVAAGDWPGVSRQAHALKGAGGNVGARSFALQASALEQAAAAGPVADIDAALERLAASLTVALTALRTPHTP